MSKAMKCDRCGQYVDIRNNSKEARCAVTTMALIPNTIEYDLCEECAEELNRFRQGREENE